MPGTGGRTATARCYSAGGSLKGGREPNGRITARVNGQVKPIGQLTLAVFPNAGGLDAIGQSAFVETANSGAAQLVKPGAAPMQTVDGVPTRS